MERNEIHFLCDVILKIGQLLASRLSFAFSIKKILNGWKSYGNIATSNENATFTEKSLFTRSSKFVNKSVPLTCPIIPLIRKIHLTQQQKKKIGKNQIIRKMCAVSRENG